MKLRKNLENILLGTIIAAGIATHGFFLHQHLKDMDEIKKTQAETKAYIEEKEAAKRIKEEFIKKREAAKVNPEDMITVDYEPPKEFLNLNSIKKVILPSKTIIYDHLPNPKILQTMRKVISVAEKDYMAVIKELKTPLEAALYCIFILEYKDDIEVYGTIDYHASFKYVHENKKDDCDGGAESAAAILSDNKYPPYIAILSNSWEDTTHEVFIYKTSKGKYGSIGINRGDYQFCDSLEKLKNEIGKSFGKMYEKIEIYDLGKLFPDHIDNDKNNDPTP